MKIEQVKRRHISFSPAEMLRSPHLADRGAVIHHFLKQDRGVTHVVTGDQAIGVVHAGRMHGEPIYDAQRLIVGTDELYLRQCLVYVMLVPGNDRQHQSRAERVRVGETVEMHRIVRLARVFC